MTPTRRQVAVNAGRAVVGASAIAALASCATPVAPRRHAYLSRQLDGYRRDVVVCDADGRNARTILQGAYGRPGWAPDGQHLVVSRGAADDSQGTWALWVMRSDGSLLHRITSPPSGVADLDPTFHPNGHTIAFTRDTVGFGYGEGIWLVRADGSGLHFVPGAAGGITPTFDNAGGQIAYAAADGIRAVPVAGGNPRLMARAYFPWQLTQPTWSPDGRRVAFVRQNFGSMSLCYFGRGEPVTELNSSPDVIETPAWSKDSATLTYMGVQGLGAEGRTSAAVFLQAIGSPARQVFRPAAFAPATNLATWRG